MRKTKPDPATAKVAWTPKKEVGRPPKEGPRKLATLEDDAAYEMQTEALSRRSEHLATGVNMTWLATAFRIDPRTCRKRLAGLKPISYGHHNAEVYDFVEASTYLAPPHPDQFARYMRSLRTQDMPTQLQDTYWSALRKRQIWEQNAGHLWKTDDVMEVMAEVFKTIKSTMQLWVDNLDSTGEMSEDQRTRLTQMVDGLQNEVYHGLVELPSLKQTRSSLYDPDVISNQGGNPPDDADEDLIG